MDASLILARAMHFASTVSLVGIFAFAVFVMRPAVPNGDVLRRRLMAIAWASLAAAVLSGAAWLVLEAEQMSGRSLIDVLDHGILGTVFERTRLGRVWQFRLGLAVLSIGCLFVGGRVRGWTARDLVDRAMLLLSALSLAAIAWTGHAAAASGAEGKVQLAADAAHLLAAGAWLGGLVPLALLLAAARRADRLPAGQALTATRRFSMLGIASVATLLATGGVNAWFLTGSVPALLGTLYGRLLLLKLMLFTAMLVLAAINRTRLTPRLMAAGAGDGPAASRKLRRNALIEAVLGTLVLVIVGMLGTTPPGLHVQPTWPLPFRLSLDAVAELPDLRNEVVATAAIAGLGLLSIVYGCFARRYRRWSILVGGALFLGIGWRPVALLAVTAYPTSFYRSPVPLTVPSIAQGTRIYAENCVACHGAEGRGDGEAARTLPVAPADLTAEHIFGHPDGDLFWWIRHGMDGGIMPGFAPSIDDRATWDLINFIHARAAGVQASDLSAEVTGFPSPAAPDFSFDLVDGGSSTLLEQARKGAVLLIFFTLPQSQPRLERLARWRRQLAGNGLTLIALSAKDPGHGLGDGESLPDFVATASKEVAEAYTLYERRGRAGPTQPLAGHREFLIDRAGHLRARWRPGDQPDWDDLSNLRRQVNRLAELPIAPIVHAGHVH